MIDAPLPVFDGHNDLLLALWTGEEPRHVQLAAAAGAGFGGGFFACWAPPSPGDEPPDHAAASAAVGGQADILLGLEEAGALRVVRSAGELPGDGLAAILHFEGAEPVAADLSDLEAWYARGLRSVGLVWSRPNAFGEGVRFRYPGTPDTGPGLTRAGRELVRACNRLGVMVDVSHLNLAGFRDVAELSDAPLAATHSNAWSLTPSPRNLVDEQLDAIAASGGVVGITFAADFLRSGDRPGGPPPLSRVVDHAGYVRDRIGLDHVALGSDFDGAAMPAGLRGVVDLPRLVATFRAAGWDDAALTKLCRANWLRVLERTLAPAQPG